MEIHRRTRATNSNASDTPKTNGASSSSRGGRRLGRPMTDNPYTGPPTLIDVILLRSIKFLLILAAAWFSYVIAVINSPSLEALEAASLTTKNDGNAGGGDRLGGASSSWQSPKKVAAADPLDVAAARDKIAQLRTEFYGRYGGEMAKEMLRRGLRTFENRSGDSREGGGDGTGGAVRATADRFLGAVARHGASASSSGRPEFVMAFAGYSVTVGRGNHLEQSYPYVIERILSPVLLLPPFGIKLVVRNSAIGGIPSFPYGWCLSNFLGKDADMVSWDYGMNEGSGASGLESYVRQSLMMPKSPPMFVLLDMKRPRLDLLQKYADLGVLPDPVALGGRNAVDKKLLQLPEGERPAGLQKWDEWGAPKGAPGQSPWHPKKMEHELMGWMMTMHMLDALEVALEVVERDANWRSEILERERRRNSESAERFLPPPVTDVSETGAASILHGSASESDGSKWHMNSISCRTSFLPNIYGDLNSIVQSGVTKNGDDMLQTRDDSLFVGGWVMDVGKLERDTKVKVQKYGGLGYIDMKTALYGIPSSGMLKLWLPHEGLAKAAGAGGASEYFNAVVLCEVNEKRGDDECGMATDLAFRLGGAAVAADGVSQVKGVASYLKKDICIRVEIPDGAKTSFKSGETNGVGLDVEITVTGNGVSREKGACSISHVIWENL